MDDYDVHQAHLAMHNEMRVWLEETWYGRYQTAPRWKRRVIDWLLRA